MQIYRNNKIFTKALFVSLLITLVVFISTYLGFNVELSRLKQQERLNVTEKFIKYKANLESLIYSNVLLSKGYLAYIKSNPNLTEEDTLNYLHCLISPDDKLIKNLSIIKDTTIKWVYPVEGNEAAIGKNLQDIPEQKESILKVKNTLKPTFVGPVNLIQGGTGFISRIPITLKDGTYWGQLSIVIYSDELLKQAGFFETDNDLNILIFNKTDYPDKPLLGDFSIMNYNPLLYDIAFEDLEWKIAVVPKAGWSNFKSLSLMWTITTTLISIIIGFMLFLLIFTKARLRGQAFYDSLTKIYNRTYLYEQVVPALTKSKKPSKMSAIFLMDLNGFKMINDVYGHKAGDEALKITAQRLASICNKNDVVIRLGGDEFLIIFSIDSIASVEKIKSQIRTITSQEFTYEIFKIKPSASIGYSIFPLNGTNIENLMNIADKKMYEEKELYKKLKK